MVLSLSPWAQAASAFADNEANLSLSTGVDAAISDSEDATVENATADATEDNANVGTTANDATIEDDAQDGEVAEEGSNGAAVAKAQAVDAPAADSASETTNDATATDSTNYVIDGTKSIADLLGEARFYGIVANQWRVSESQTNAAVKELVFKAGQSGNDLTNIADQPWYIGSVTGGTMHIKGYDADVYTPKSEFTKIVPDSLKITFHETDKPSVDAYVDLLKADATSRLAGQVSNQSFSTELKVDSAGTHTSNATGELSGDTSGVVLDLTSKPAGTYYINAETLFGNSNPMYNLKAINKNSDQVVFFNFPTASTINLNQISYEMNHSGAAGEDAMARGIVWNMPNASTVNINSQQFGIFFAPNAALNIISGYNSGWIIANTVQNDGGMEFHNVYQEMQSKRGKTQLEATKTVNGEAPGDAYAGKFTFQLKDESGQVVDEQTCGANGKVTFKYIDFRQNIDWNNGTPVKDSSGNTIGYEKTFKYTVNEVIPSGATKNDDGTYTLGDIVYDVASKDVTVHVVDYAENSDIGVTIDYNDAAAAFNNRTAVGSLKVAKSFAGDLSADKLTGAQKEAITFEVKDADGKAVSTFTYADMTDGSITIGNLAPGNYTVEETNGNVDGYTTTISYSVEGGSVAVAKDQTASVTVTNTYEKKSEATGKAQLKAEKTVDGEATKVSGFQFKAEVMEQDADGQWIEISRATNNGSSIVFDPIEYTAEGEHVYRLSEVQGPVTINGVEYATDSTVYYAKVVVHAFKDTAKDASSHTSYVAEPAQYFTDEACTVPIAQALPVFDNATDPQATLQVQKVIDGRNWQDGDSFQFVLSSPDNSPMPADVDEGGTKTITVTSEDAAPFGTIVYAGARAKAPITYNYTIKEVVPDDSAKIEGMTYDTQEHKVAVKVTKAEDDTYSVTVTYDGKEAQALTVTNTYEAKEKATAKAQLNMKKQLSTGDAVKEGVYTF